MSNRSVPLTGTKSTGDDAATPRPAFTSNIAAFCFLALVAFALVLPILIAQTNLLTRRDSYGIMPEKTHPYSFLENEIFDNKEDIDILFLGSSLIWAAVDTPQVQKALSDSLGRPARAVTFGHSYNSIDTSYLQLRDLLERKRVRMIVFSVPRVVYNDGPSVSACKFFGYGENRDVTDELPFKYRASLYGCNVLRSPHDLLTIIRKNRSNLTPYADTLGALRAETGWGLDPAAFEKFDPQPPFATASDLTYSPATREQFEFTNERIPFYQNHYLKKLVELLKSKQVPLMMINVPQHTERRNAKAIEIQNWSETLGFEVPLIGIPPATLFAGLSEEEIKRLYYNEHMNINGNGFFTRAILPGILEVYDKHAPKH